jgi:hypothetical protein
MWYRQSRNYLQKKVWSMLTIDNNRRRKLVHSLFKSEQKNSITSITWTALYYLIKQYELISPTLPFPIEDSIRITNLYRAIKKTFFINLIGTSLTLMILVGSVLSFTFRREDSEKLKNRYKCCSKELFRNLLGSYL